MIFNLFNVKLSLPISLGCTIPLCLAPVCGLCLHPVLPITVLLSLTFPTADMCLAAGLSVNSHFHLPYIVTSVRGHPGYSSAFSFFFT